jgi:hypothetical protein
MRNPRREQAEAECGDVRQHVAGIRQQRQGVRPPSAQSLSNRVDRGEHEHDRKATGIAVAVMVVMVMVAVVVVMMMRQISGQ